jgi:hypothetical protein
MPFDRWNLLLEVYNDIIADRNAANDAAMGGD